MPTLPEPVEYNRARQQLGFGLVLSLSLIGGGAWATFLGGGAVESRVLGVPMMLVGALFLWAAVSPPKGSAMSLRLDAEGICLRHPFNGYTFALPWSEVTGVRIEYFDGNRLVVLDTQSPLQNLEDTDEVGREMRRKRLSAVGSRFVVPASLFGQSPEALAAEIDRFRLAYAAVSSQGAAPFA